MVLNVELIAFWEGIIVTHFEETANTVLTQDTSTISINQLLTSHAWIKIFNILPSDPKSLMSERVRFKIALKRYFNTHSFYSVDEYLLSIM
jgi:hypothetical protein